MAIRVVCNMKLDMTGDEFGLYQNIVKSYTVGQNRGEDLFTDLFVSDEQGMIRFLRPPSKRQTSMEIYLFLMTLQQQQVMRTINKQVDDMVSQIKTKVSEIDLKLSQLK